MAKTDDKPGVESTEPGGGSVDAKFDQVKSGGTAVEEGGATEQRPQDGAPKLGDGAKSAHHNELPTEPPRSEADTVGMPAIELGAPPAMPTVEDPTVLPAAKDVPTGDPTAPALPPGRVPRGDSRSLRRGDSFALVYRQGTFVITRVGTVGQRGEWRVVEYPTVGAASNAYARASSGFVADGFSDYRD